MNWTSQIYHKVTVFCCRNNKTPQEMKCIYYNFISLSYCTSKHHDQRNQRWSSCKHLVNWHWMTLMTIQWVHWVGALLIKSKTVLFIFFRKQIQRISWASLKSKAESYCLWLPLHVTSVRVSVWQWVLSKWASYTWFTHRFSPFYLDLK